MSSVDRDGQGYTHDTTRKRLEKSLAISLGDFPDEAQMKDGKISSRSPTIDVTDYSTPNANSSSIASKAISTSPHNESTKQSNMDSTANPFYYLEGGSTLYARRLISVGLLSYHILCLGVIYSSIRSIIADAANPDRLTHTSSESDLGGELSPVRALKDLRLSILCFRPLALVILMNWGWGLNIHVWKNVGLDFNSLLGIPRSAAYSNPVRLCNTLILLSSVWIGSVAVFVWSFAYLRPPLLGWPLPMVALFVNHFTIFIALTIPSDPLNLRVLWINFRRCLVAPFLSPALSDGVLADILTSLSGPLSDVPTGFCMSVGGIFYPLVTWDLLDPIDSESRAFETEFDVIEQCPQLFLIHVLVPLFLAWPYLCRLLQCSRQVYNEQTLLCSPFFNALKYCTIFPVHALSIMMQYSSPNQILKTIRPSWIAAATLNSSYSLYWDIYWDWSFVHFWPWNVKREVRDIGFYPAFTFYVILVSNAMMRFAWTVRFADHGLSRNQLTLLLQCTEIFRRFAWIFFRVEKAAREGPNSPNRTVYTPRELREKPGSFHSSINFACACSVLSTLVLVSSA